VTTEHDKRPTLKTIAKISGFAVPTVSRALKGAPDIKRETVARVRQIAADIGYVPNRAGVRLKTGRTHVISLILSTEHDMMNHTARLISSVAGALRDTPFHLNVTPFFPDEDPMRAVRYVVETGSADAIILNQTEPQDPRVAYLMERGFPFATHGRTDWADQHPYYDFDNFFYGQLAVQNLRARGRRNLLLIAPPMQQAYARHILAGSLAEAGQGLTVTNLDTVTCDSGTGAIRAAVTTYLRDTPETDGIISVSPTASLACIAAIEGLGRTLGRDIDMTVKEAIFFLQMFRPDLLVFREDVTLAGAFLARAVLQAISAPDEPPLQMLEQPQNLAPE